MPPARASGATSVSSEIKGAESQREFILRLLKDYGQVSAHDLVFLHGITRAGARIWELRREGYPIVTDPSRVLDDGSRSMAVYRLPRADQTALPW